MTGVTGSFSFLFQAQQNGGLIFKVFEVFENVQKVSKT